MGFFFIFDKMVPKSYANNMNKFLKFLVGLIFVLNSCSKINDAQYTYHYYEQKQLNIESYDHYMKFSKIEEGSNLVFSYEYVAEDDASVDDDEYAEYIRFEIDPKLSEFNYKDDELSETKAVFSVSCFCSFSDDPEKDVPPKGIIRGEKISPTQWSISIDVVFYGHDHRNLTHIFQLKN